MNLIASETGAKKAEDRTNIQDIAVFRSNIRIADSSCCTGVKLLGSTDTIVPPPQRWNTPGFTVELYDLPPFIVEGQQSFTAFSIYFGPMARQITINSDCSQPDRLQAGDIDFLPAGTTSKAIATNTAPFVYIKMTPERVAQLTDALFGNRPGHLQPRLKIRMPNARLLYRLLREYLLEQSERGTVYLEALLTVLATEVFRRVWSYADLVPSARHSLAPAIRRRMIEYIAANLTADLSLTRLAAVACLSPYHFARCFRQEFGKPPHRYVLDQRLEFARQLLADTNLPMAAVAARCGFASQGRLATAFRTRFGIAPRQYNSNRTGILLARVQNGL